MQKYEDVLEWIWIYLWPYFPIKIYNILGLMVIDKMYYDRYEYRGRPNVLCDNVVVKELIDLIWKEIVPIFPN
jgi:hypothetical protein